ncbi:MAG TPA: hypothetical protein VK203_24580 [Nostocaceae cyanobacterium]|nr:hypothetical protein [Nostocaceae cyanobacterium]
MSVQFINIKSELIEDLSPEQQQLLAGGQNNSTTGRLSGGIPANPGTTIVVPDMLYTVPPTLPNNLFGNPSSSSSKETSNSED